MKFKSLNNFIVSSSTNEVFVAPISDGVASADSFLVLNSVSARILELFQEDKSVDEVVDSILDEYNVEDADVVRFDVISFGRKMVRYGFLTVEE